MTNKEGIVVKLRAAPPTLSLNEKGLLYIILRRPSRERKAAANRLKAKNRQ